jgi:hypothetical protein
MQWLCGQCHAQSVPFGNVMIKNMPLHVYGVRCHCTTVVTVVSASLVARVCPSAGTSPGWCVWTASPADLPILSPQNPVHAGLSGADCFQCYAHVKAVGLRGRRRTGRSGTVVHAIFYSSYYFFCGARGSVVAKSLCCMPEGCGLETR